MYAEIEYYARKQLAGGSNDNFQIYAGASAELTCGACVRVFVEAVRGYGAEDR